MTHRYLRHGLPIIAVLVLVVAFINLLSGGRNFPLAIVVTAVVVLLIVFEVRHYHPSVQRGHGRWQKTDETFIDPTSGERMRVYFNPETGQRDYRRED